MTDALNPQHWNGEHLPETLAALRIWQHDPDYEEAEEMLQLACNRLFAAPEPAPRSEAEQAVLHLLSMGMRIETVQQPR